MPYFYNRRVGQKKDLQFWLYFVNERPANNVVDHKCHQQLSLSFPVDCQLCAAFMNRKAIHP